MVIAKLNGKVYMFNSLQCYHKATWSPSVTLEEVYKLKGIKGNYKEQKNYIRNLAINIFSLISEYNPSYLELAEITEFFNKQAKKLGLITEFKTEGII